MVLSEDARIAYVHSENAPTRHGSAAFERLMDRYAPAQVESCRHVCDAQFCFGNAEGNLQREKTRSHININIQEFCKLLAIEGQRKPPRHISTN